MHSPRNFPLLDALTRPGNGRRLLSWLRGRPLARDITVILCIKFALLIILKYAFFDHPAAEHMSLPPDVVAHQLLDAPINPHLTQGDHDAR